MVRYPARASMTDVEQRLLDGIGDHTLRRLHRSAMCPAASKLELLTPTLSVMVRGGWGGFGHEGRAVPSSRCDDPHLILSKRSLRANEGETSSPREFRLEGAEG